MDENDFKLLGFFNEARTFLGGQNLTWVHVFLWHVDKLLFGRGISLEVLSKIKNFLEFLRYFTNKINVQRALLLACPFQCKVDSWPWRIYQTVVIFTTQYVDQCNNVKCSFVPYCEQRRRGEKNTREFLWETEKKLMIFYLDVTVAQCAVYTMYINMSELGFTVRFGIICTNTHVYFSRANARCSIVWYALLILNLFINWVPLMEPLMRALTIFIKWFINTLCGVSVIILTFMALETVDLCAQVCVFVCRFSHFDCDWACAQTVYAYASFTCVFFDARQMLIWMFARNNPLIYSK